MKIHSTGFLHRLQQGKSGVAMVEFALALPVVCLATVGGLELAWVAIQQQKVAQVAAQAADNAARVTGVIDETDIHELMTAARLNAGSMGIMNHGRLIISSIQQNANRNGQWIRWQRCQGQLNVVSRYGVENTGRTTTSLQGVGTRNPRMVAGPGMAIIVAEVEYNYQPLISNRMFGSQVIRSETAHVVRQRTDLGIGNSTALTEAQKLRCV